MDQAVTVTTVSADSLEPNAVTQCTQRRLNALHAVETVAAQLLKVLLLMMNGEFHTLPWRLSCNSAVATRAWSSCSAPSTIQSDG